MNASSRDDGWDSVVRMAFAVLVFAATVAVEALVRGR
jgi:hypothetical protein